MVDHLGLLDLEQVQLTTGSAAARLVPKTPVAPEEVVEETAEELVVAAMVLVAAVEVVAAYQVVVPLDKALFLLRAPFGQYGPVAAFELYLYTAVDSRPGPGGSRTTASCQP